MSCCRLVSIALGLMAGSLSVATAAEQNQLTVGVGLDRFLSVEGGLTDANRKKMADIKVSDDKVASWVVISPRRLWVAGRRPGKVTLSITTLDGKRHRYDLQVVKPTQEMLEPAGVKLMDIGVGQARILESPIAMWVAKRGDASWIISCSDPRALDFQVVSLKHVVVVGERPGYSNLTFISPADVLTTFHFRVTNSRYRHPADQRPEQLSLVVGKPVTLKLPAPVETDRVILTRPELVEIEESARTNKGFEPAPPPGRGPKQVQQVKRSNTLTLVPKVAGTTDLVVLSLSNGQEATKQPKGTARFPGLVHYQITIKDPKRGGKE